MLYLQAKVSLYQQVLEKVKKLVVVLATSMSMTDKKTEEEWEQIPCI